jgi:hypothetical protein
MNLPSRLVLFSYACADTKDGSGAFLRLEYLNKSSVTVTLTEIGAALAKRKAARFAQDKVDHGLPIGVIYGEKTASQAAELPNLPFYHTRLKGLSEVTGKSVLADSGHQSQVC